MRKILVVGCIVAVFILILASLPSVVSVQATESTVEGSTSIVQRIKGKIAEDDWEPGELWNYLFAFIVAIFIVPKECSKRVCLAG